MRLAVDLRGKPRYLMYNVGKIKIKKGKIALKIYVFPKKLCQNV